MNGLHGQVALLHVDQARNLELFKYKRNMGANYALDYHRGTVTTTPVQVSTFIIEKNGEELKIMNSRKYVSFLARPDF